MTSQSKILNNIISEFDRRVYEEGYARIEKCLTYFSEEEVWHRPNENTPSLANLVLHLSGNVRQWICAGLGGKADVRKRDTEFSAKGGYTKKELLEIVETAINDAKEVLNTVNLEDLESMKKVQVYEESGLTIVMHVIEHFSYHVGQITYAAKTMKNVDTQYYPEDLGLSLIHI